MSKFESLMRHIVQLAVEVHNTVALRPELVGEDADLNDWARDVANELNDMRILLEERAKR